MNEETRKEFEAKMSELGFGEHNKHDFDIDEETGDYVDHDLNAMKVGFLIGWKAHSEAMKPIKLPSYRGSVPGGDNAFSENDVIESIKKAGYKVEE